MPQLERLVYLPEGDWNSLANYSGTPYFLGRALQSECAHRGVSFEVVSTDFFINTEDVWRIIARRVHDHVVDVDGLRTPQREHPLTSRLLSGLRSCATWRDSMPLVREYLTGAAEIVAQLLARFSSRSAVVCLNTLNPPCTSTTLPVFAYLDIPLTDFYFSDPPIFLPWHFAAPELRKLYQELEDNCIRQAREIFFFSKFAEQLCVARFGSNVRTRTIGAGVNFELNYAPPFQERKFDRPLRLLFVGTHFDAKGGAALLKAMEAFSSERCSLTVVTRLEFRRKYQPHLADTTPVIWQEPVDKDELCDLYRSHDLFIFPTLYDAYGISICEAMLHSMPVIGTRTRAVPEIVGDTAEDLLVAPNDPDAITRAIEFACAHRGLLQQIARKDWWRTSAEYRWEVVAERILELVSKH